MKLKRELSSDGEDALRALHMNDKRPLAGMVEWVSLDTFRIAGKTFQIKEVQDDKPQKQLPGQMDIVEELEKNNVSK